MPRSVPSSKRAHFCTVCQKTFTTSGHLLRHSKVHTGEKKHKCPFPGCQTSCSRQDNLQQHYRIHLAPGSRRSASANVTKSSPAPSESNRRSLTPAAPITPPTHIRSLSEDVPYTIVDGPPVLQVPPKDNSLPNPPTLPSPPNTPPPLVPASPRLVLLRQQGLNRRHSTGALENNRNGYVDDDARRPLSSSSSSSSSTSSPVPLPFEPFSHMISLDEIDNASPDPRLIAVSDAFHSVWVPDDGGYPCEDVVATPEEYMSTTPMAYAPDLSKSSSFHQQPTYGSNPTSDYFGYTNFPTSSHHAQPTTTTSFPLHPPPDNSDFLNPSSDQPTATPDYMMALNSEVNPKPFINDQLFDSYQSYYAHQSSPSYPYIHQTASVSSLRSQSLGTVDSGFASHASTATVPATTTQVLHSQQWSNANFGWDLW
jgi:hypothetical protein